MVLFHMIFIVSLVEFHRILSYALLRRHFVARVFLQFFQRIPKYFFKILNFSLVHFHALNF